MQYNKEKPFYSINTIYREMSHIKIFLCQIIKEPVFFLPQTLDLKTNIGFLIDYHMSNNLVKLQYSLWEILS